MINNLKLVLATLVALVFLSGGAHAQNAGVLPSAQDVSAQAASDLNLDEFSAPSVDLVVSASGKMGTGASLAAKTTNIDDNAATFEWYLDDELAPSLVGRAKTAFSFTTSKPSHLVRVVVSINNKKVAENTAAIHSFNVALAWHTDTFVPAEYEGRALPIVGSRVTVSALPEIKNEQPEDLLYTWYVDAESRVRNVVGEQDFTFTVTKNVRFVSIIVEVSNQGQSITVR
ncbi:hypothetical protein HYR65_02315, partial [Candidatus Azambacteria bacterium]|nr:hypothetical protein [Candidatus Azambacteria bacterium]